jgi:hypothetical protein
MGERLGDKEAGGGRGAAHMETISSMYEGVLSASHVEDVAIVKGDVSINIGVDTARDDGLAAVGIGRL